MNIYAIPYPARTFRHAGGRHESPDEASEHSQRRARSRPVSVPTCPAIRGANCHSRFSHHHSPVRTSGGYTQMTVEHVVGVEDIALAGGSAPDRDFDDWPRRFATGAVPGGCVPSLRPPPSLVTTSTCSCPRSFALCGISFFPSFVSRARHDAAPALPPSSSTSSSPCPPVERLSLPSFSCHISLFPL